MKHPLPSELRRSVVTFDLVGCGGTGSLLLAELARFHVALKASGHPGLHVTVFDPDTISEANVGRTLFAPSDVGQYKITPLLTRINAQWGLHWTGVPRKYVHPLYNPHPTRLGAPPDFLVTTTDSLRSRVELARQIFLAAASPPRYWLDCGNDADTGQVILGEPSWAGDAREYGDTARPPRLRCVTDLFPDMAERAEGEAEEPESCSLLAALDRQSLFINRHMSTWAAELLWRFFRDGGLDYHGVYVNAKTGRVNPIPVAGPTGRPPVDLSALVAARQGPKGTPPAPETTRRGRVRRPIGRIRRRALG